MNDWGNLRSQASAAAGGPVWRSFPGKQRPSGLSHRFIQHAGRMAVSTIVLAELYAWAYGRDDPTPVHSTRAGLAMAGCSTCATLTARSRERSKLSRYFSDRTG